MSLSDLQEAAKRFNFEFNCWQGDNAEQDAQAILSFLKERFKLKGKVEDHEGEFRILIQTRRTYWMPSPSAMAWHVQQAEDHYNGQ